MVPGVVAGVDAEASGVDVVVDAGLEIVRQRRQRGVDRERVLGVGIVSIYS